MRILLVEDDKNLNHTLKYQLEKSGFTVDNCYDGEEALYYISQNIHDVLLLDRMLPLINGTEVLKQIRSSGNSIPVILITAMGSLQDKITGLDTGADDYLVKPFEFEELLARIRSVTRRPHVMNADDAFNFGDISLSINDSKLTGPVSSCSLSKKESELFEIFFRNPEQTLTRETLLTKVWGIETDVENGNLDNYIHFLRRRLKTVGSLVHIQTVRGIGYCLKLSEID